jgi:site-specific DNA-cytosine methylase
MRELIIDSFAGGGGASFGIGQAGFRVDVAINHDADAIAMHTANHPETAHYPNDIWSLKPASLTKGRALGLLWASPDCFPAGTLVLTADGYIPIEQVHVGDLVLTHRGRWRRVNQTMSSVKNTMTIRGHGHFGLAVSSEHPFLSVHRTNTWDNSVRRYVPTFDSPQWTKASELTPLTGRDASQSGHYWSSPTKFEPLAIPEVGGRGMYLDDRLMWLAGRYLADGWTRLTDTRAELVIICGKDEVNALKEKLASWPRSSARSQFGELEWHFRELETACQFSTNHRGLVDWLRTNFGHLAHEKRIPGWMLGAPETIRAAFLTGYMSGDGWKSQDFMEATTVSKALAFGVKSLAMSFGHAVAVYKSHQHSNEIEGRKINSRDVYKLRWRHHVDADHEQTRCDDLHRYTPIREIESGIDGQTEVYNLSVDEDESYVAESIVVHNCTHFSRAKGAKPVKKHIRSLAWVVVKWAAEVRPRVIILENVREFEDWGPLVQKIVDGVGQVLDDGSPVLVPDPTRKGHSFKRWAGRLRNLGYEVQWRVLNASDFGAPTHRRRLFLIARCDGQKVVWPEPTHGDPKKINAQPLFGTLQPWRTAAECIDWSIACPSIFERKRPLAENTLRRIAMGIKRYVLENPTPFIVRCEHGGDHFRGQSIDQPLSTVTGKHGYGVVIAQLAHGNGPAGTTFGDGRVNAADQPLGTVHAGGNNHALVSACLVGAGGPSNAGKPRPVDEPIGTLMTENHRHVVAATMVQTGYTERKGQSPRCLDLEKPLGTCVNGQKHALVSAFLAKHFGGVVGVPADGPTSTVTAKDHHSLVAANLIHLKNNTQPSSPSEPMNTVMAGGNHAGLVAANIIRMNHGEKQWNGADEPLPTVTSGNHAALVYSFLVKYFGTAIGASLIEPMPTATGKDRFGLVTVSINGEPYVIVDIGMRMLSPRELARAQGFPDSYILTGSKSSQVARIGNSVCPVMAEVLVKANYVPAKARRKSRAS